MKLSSAVAVTLVLLVVSMAATAFGQTWTPLTNPAPVSMGAMLLLTDGRVLVHEEPNCSGAGCVGSDYTAWYTLTPDVNGSYINGTWTKVASLPTGYSPLFFSSAVLPDGKVGVQGGEYNCPSGNCADAWQSLAALYDPSSNTWTSITPAVTNSWKADGDAESVVLANGSWMVAACCAVVTGHSTFPLYFYFNESGLNFTGEASSSDGKADEFDEEGWTLLPNGKVLTVDAYVGSYNSSGKNSELYNPATNTWASAGSTQVQLWDDACGNSSKASYEVGPAVLMPNGTVFYTGASECQAGNTATYNWSTGTWTAQSAFPNKGAANDAPAAVEINGNAIVMTSPYTGTFSSPSTFYEWNGTSLSTFPNPANAANDASFDGHLLVLPTGQIMFTDFTTGVEILTSAGTYQAAWQPTITNAPFSLVPGQTYSISGTQFNGLTGGSAYGDDFQNATNYPLVRIVNNATGHVYYAKTHGHSSMGVATGATAVSTNFDVPAGIPAGACELYVVANGIPSAASACSVGASTPSTTSLSSSANPATYGQSVTFTATVSGSSGTPTGTVQFTANSSTIAGCNSVALSSGIAHCTTTVLFVGSETIGAAYSGDGTYVSSSGSLTQTVNQASVSVSVGSNKNPSTYGQPVTFTATISGANGQARGPRAGRMRARPMTVTGSVTWSSNTGCGTTPVTAGTPGVATCMTSILPVGTDTVGATYSGDSNHNAGSASTSQVVTQVSTATAVTSSLNPSGYGQSVNFTATVTGASPTGTVQFFVDSVLFDTETLSGGSATSIGTMTLAVGNHTVTATYAGDTNNATSSGSLAGGQTVTISGAAVVVGSSLNPSNFGQSVTFTATISGDNGLVKGRKSNFKGKPMNPTGTVTWSANTGCSVSTVSGNPGVATCTTSSLASGTDLVTASYSGDANHNPGSGSVSQVVNSTTSGTIVNSSADPSAYGQAVAFTAAVTGNSPTGTVQFFIDSVLFDTETLVSGSATSASISTLAVGTHTVSANYSGDGSNAPSTGTLAGGQQVGTAGSTTVVTSTPNPSTYAASVTFTATITADNSLLRGRTNMRGKAQDVTGTVTWSSNTGCSPSTVSGYPGVATCTTTSLGAGTDTVTAIYSGDASHAGSSGSTNQSVAQQSQTIVFSINAPASAVYGSSFMVAASASSGLPVSFTSAGACSNAGATYTMTSGTGSCSVTASQAGNSNYAPATPVSESTTAAPASQTITVATAAPPTAVDKTSFTVVASASSGLPVAFASAGACTNAGATYTMDSAKLGAACTVTMSQAGNGNYTAATPIVETTKVAAAIPPTVSVSGPASAPYLSTYEVVAASNASTIPTITAAPATVCTISGTTVTMMSGTGTCTVTAKWAADNVYKAASAKLLTTAEKLTPTVTFTGAPAEASNGSGFTVTATSNESGPFVSLPKITATPTTVCSVGAVSSNGPGSYQATVTMKKATGTCTTKAAWAANAGYVAASALQSTMAQP